MEHIRTLETRDLAGSVTTGGCVGVVCSSLDSVAAAASAERILFMLTVISFFGILNSPCSCSCFLVPYV